MLANAGGGRALGGWGGAGGRGTPRHTFARAWRPSVAPARPVRGSESLSRSALLLYQCYLLALLLNSVSFLLLCLLLPPTLLPSPVSYPASPFSTFHATRMYQVSPCGRRVRGGQGSTRRKPLAVLSRRAGASPSSAQRIQTQQQAPKPPSFSQALTTYAPPGWVLLGLQIPC